MTQRNYMVLEAAQTKVAKYSKNETSIWSLGIQQDWDN